MSAKLRIATFLAPNMFPVYEFLVDALGRELGGNAELVIGASFDQFGNGEIDAGFICGLPYGSAHETNPDAGRVAGSAGAAGRSLRGPSDLLLRCHRA
jgi:hypothetical protein